LTVSNAAYQDLLADDFNRTNSTNVGGFWLESSGNWPLLNGNVGIRSSGNGYLLLEKNFNTSLINDFIAEFRYRTFGGSANGYLAFEFDRDRNVLGNDVDGLQIRLFKNGSVGLYNGTTRLGTVGNISGSSASWHDVRAVRRANEFRLYVDGNLVLNVDISSWIGQGHHFGMEIKNTASEFDDFRVYPADGRAVYTAYENHYQYAEKSVDAAGYTLRSLQDMNGAPVASIDEKGKVVSTISGSTSQFRRDSFSKVDPDLILNTAVYGD